MPATVLKLLYIIVVFSALGACATRPPSSPSASPTLSPSGSPTPAPSCPPTAWSATQPGATVGDGALDEISGLAASTTNPGLLWVIEDSGNPADVVGISATTGQTVTTLHVTAATNRDWEDLALGPCPAGTCLFVAEIGDNAEVHAQVSVLRIPEPQNPVGDLNVAAETFSFVYPDSAHNAEALIVLPNETIAILTKTSGGVAQVFQATLGDAQASEVGAITTGGSGFASLVTGADLWPDGSRLLVRTYSNIIEITFPGAIDLAALDNAPRETVPSRPETQGEAVAYDTELCGYWHVSEAVNPPLYFTAAASSSASP